MLSAYVMCRVGTFTLEEKVKIIEFISYMAVNPDKECTDLKNYIQLNINGQINCIQNHVIMYNHLPWTSI